MNSEICVKSLNFFTNVIQNSLVYTTSDTFIPFKTVIFSKADLICAILYERFFIKLFLYKFNIFF